MQLYLIGIGFGNAEDLTVSGINSINICSKLYLLDSKYYSYNQKDLEDYLSREVILVAPDDLEEKIFQLVSETCQEREEANALLMPGNPFCENYFPMIKYNCSKFNICLKIIHNVSYLNAMGNTGIQLYKFGETVYVNSCDNEVNGHLQIINSNLQRQLNTLVVFRREPHVKLAAELVAMISKLDADATKLSPSSKLVLLIEEEGKRYFDFGAASELQNVVNTKVVPALAVCSEFDCVEEEYLKKVKHYHHEFDKNQDSSGKRGKFYLVGLGLGKPQDITLRGQKLIERSDKVFLEGYTSIMLGGKEELEKFFHKDIVVADREMVEQNSDAILDHLETGENVSFLVVGDPFGATTHADILLRALDKGAEIGLANNASIMNTVGLSGLKPRRFGGTVSIPFWTDCYRPDSFYDKIAANRQLGRHTLCLLDIQVKEQSLENLARGRKIYEKPRYMSTSVAAQQLLESKVKRLEEGKGAFLIDENTETISLIRIATEDEDLPYSLLGELSDRDQGPPLHSLIVIGEMDEDERNCIHS